MLNIFLYVLINQMEISSFFDLALKVITYLGGWFAFYVFIQRVHNQTQQRALKAISDEIIKINDFVIEFSVKYNKLKTETKYNDKYDEKIVSELLILKEKINAHLNYITAFLTAFPYGGPLKYIFYMLMKNRYENKDKIHADDLELQYQDAIVDNTILSIDISFLYGGELRSFNDEDKLLKRERIDLIINLGNQLQEHLEDNTRKFI